MALRMAKFALLAIMILNGIFFTVNIYVLGDRTAAIAMHLDLAPTAGTLMVNAKVLVTFIAGILYLLAAFGLVRKRPGFLLSGVVACILFNGLYAVEIVKWGSFHPWVWKGFFTAGGLSFLIGACSYVFWKKGAI